MNKKEYIKILRELSNYFKSECINTDDFSKNVDDFFEDINYENQIKRIENAIEFFKDTSEEEVQKYLSYKMGDSKKIN